MANIKIRTTRVAINTGTGTQDFTIAGFGTPKAVLFIFPTAPTDATANNNALFGMGAADGTRQWTICNTSQNAVSATNVFKRGMTDMCLSLINTTSGAVVGEAHWDSWITDGVRVNWTTAFSVASLVTIVLIGGDDLTARVDTINLGTSTSPQTYNSLSAAPNVIIGATIGNAFSDTALTTFNFGFGIATNNPGEAIVQSSIHIAENDAVADGAPFAQTMNDRFLFEMAPSNGAINYEVTLSNFTATGFDFTSSASGGSDDMGIIALSLGGGFANSGTYNPPTGTGATQLGPGGWTPQFALFGLTGCRVNDTLEGDGDAGVFGISAIDATNQFSSSLAIEDLSATTDTQTYTDNIAIALPAHDGASQLYTGTLTSFDRDGMNLNFSVANAATREWIYLMISDGIGSLVISNKSSMRAMLRR